MLFIKTQNLVKLNNMGKFFTTKIWLEDREIEILEKYNFKEEVWETEIPKNKR